MRLVFGFLAILGLAGAPLAAGNSYQQDQTEKKAEAPQPETYFAGTVTEVTAESITVSRVVLGKKEKRVFRLTPDTKREGKLKTKVRVTVRYITTDDGDTAELIIVRSPQKKTKQ